MSKYVGQILRQMKWSQSVMMQYCLIHVTWMHVFASLLLVAESRKNAIVWDHSFLFSFTDGSLSKFKKLQRSSMVQSDAVVNMMAGFPSQYRPCIITAMTINSITVLANFRDLGPAYSKRPHKTSTYPIMMRWSSGFTFRPNHTFIGWTFATSTNSLFWWVENKKQYCDKQLKNFKKRRLIDVL